MGDFFDQAMSAQESQQPADARSSAAPFDRVLRIDPVQGPADLGIAEPLDEEFAAGDRRQKAGVVFLERVERSVTAAVVLDRAAEGADQVLQGSGHLGRGKRIQITAVGGIAQFGTPLQVRYSLAERTVASPAFG